ncbi:hypothetical protein J132_10985, partial [Termitomyces sp. J132]
EERSINTQGICDRCKVKCEADATACCCLHIISQQTEFQQQKSLVQEIIKAAGHLCILLPKFHCELNFIEFRRDLHQIRRRIIIEKTAKALGKRHDQPKGRRESFHNWSKRVQYPGWQRMSAIGTRMIKQGNKVAHQATRTELQAAIIDIDSTWEGYSEEAEVLQEMLDIIIDAGELDKDEDEDDGDFWPLT